MSAELHPLETNELLHYLLVDIFRNHWCSINYTLITNPVVNLETDTICHLDTLQKSMEITKKCPNTNTRFQIYRVGELKRHLDDKIYRILKIFDEYKYDYDIRNYKFKAKNITYHDKELDGYNAKEIIDEIIKYQIKIEKIKEAAILGDQDSMEKYTEIIYDSIFEKTELINEKKEELNKWMEKLINVYNSAKGKYLKARIYEYGICCEKNYKKSVEYYIECDKEIDDNYCFEIGYLYKIGGNGLEKDEKVAFDWFKKGHKEYDKFSSISYANYLYHGNVCQKNIDESIKIYKRILPDLEDVDEEEEEVQNEIGEAYCNYGKFCIENDNFANGFKYHEIAIQCGNENSKYILQGTKQLNKNFNDTSHKEEEEETADY